ncbi:MAG TPA: MltA domain-containing protein [Kofleriaceae bacterium]|jgi:membrane-bound lytic murein transglycosylase A
MRGTALVVSLLAVSTIARAAPEDLAGTPCVVDELTAGPPPPHDTLTLTKAKYAEIPGWTDDTLAEAVPSFLRSCERIATLADDDPVGTDGHGGKAKQWRAACRAAARVTAGDNAAARAMFEREFVPYVAAGKTGPVGKLTAYDVQELHASKTKHGAFQTPVLAKPKDLVMIDLGKFVSDGHGRHVWGRDTGAELVPYFTRVEIRKGALDGKGLELMYVDNKIDLLFAQIEGSAKATLDDGSTVWLEFAGKNGRAYKGVGGVLRGGGYLPAGKGTMQGIRQWFVDHPTRYDEIVDQDASYVFFKVSAKPGAIGSQDVILTPRRSAAVDRAFIAASTPLFVEGHAPVAGRPGVVADWRHLVIAQDTGGGILGAVRADLYWGDDAEAAETGGRMGGPGRYWVLLPKGVAK